MLFKVGFNQEFCERYGLVPQLRDDVVAVVVSDESDISVLDYVRFCAARPVELEHATPESVARLIKDHFGDDSHAASGSTRKNGSSPDPGTTGRVIEMVNQLVVAAIDDAASDVHFEPSQEGLQCRVRIDGRLQNRLIINATDTPEAISRIKIMAGLDIAEKRRPQDGRIRFGQNGRHVDIRVSVIPCKAGEKAVLRILDKEALRVDLDSIGFHPKQLSLFKEKISQPNGIVLVTGPTGSGKTTTLYAAMNYLKSPEVNISTVEDPIEYEMDGINQTQIKPQIDLTFSAMLRAILRQDPNIVMVGEIRDQETLEIAIRASLTGHMVLSTLHTNGAVATLTRLLDMGAESLLLATSLRMIVAQRLARRICPHCIQDGWCEEDRVAAIKLGLEPSVRQQSGVGCKHCRGTGFSGRVAVFELFPVTPLIQQELTQGCSEQQLTEVAKNEGFQPMTETASELIKAGITTPLEVIRELNT